MEKINQTPQQIEDLFFKQDLNSLIEILRKRRLELIDELSRQTLIINTLLPLLYHESEKHRSNDSGAIDYNSGSIDPKT